MVKEVKTGNRVLNYMLMQSREVSSQHCLCFGGTECAVSDRVEHGIFCLIGLLSPLGLTSFLYTGREAPDG